MSCHCQGEVVARGKCEQVLEEMVLQGSWQDPLSMMDIHRLTNLKVNKLTKLA